MENNTVCHLATYRSEGPRRITVGGERGARVEYEIAQLPDGRWAVRYEFDFPGYSGGSCPWEAYPTRQDCLDELRSYVLSRCQDDGSCMTNANKKAIPMLRKVFDPGDLFGFQEPEPVPHGEWYPEMIAEQLASMQLHQSWDLLDVVRAMDCKPISKSGSFFDIPLPECWKAKGRYMGCGPVEDDAPQDDEDDDTVPETSDAAN